MSSLYGLCYTSDRGVNLVRLIQVLDGIRNYDAFCLKVIPDDKTFSGKIFVLTNNKTASTCEPIIYSLKHANRALIVGEHTAGAMLNAEQFELGHSMRLWIPTAEYYTIDGKRLDKIGIAPHKKIKSSKALDYVLNLITE